MTLLFFVYLQLIEVRVSFLAHFVYFYVVICFLVSCVFSFIKSRSIDIEGLVGNIFIRRGDSFLFFSSTLIGLVGLYFYVLDFSVNVGGVEGFFITFFSDPLIIRALAQEETSIGFQLSYFSWISIPYCFYIVLTNRSILWCTRGFALLLMVAQFFFNLLFIDRTRPVILFLSLAFIFILLKSRDIKNPIRYIFYALLGPVVIFIALAIFTGKYDEDAGLVRNLLIYLLGSFGYFSSALDSIIPSYDFYRTFYPLAKLGVVFFDSSIKVPPQVLDFRSVPFETNVGTFLEPLLSDGGVVFVLVGAPLIIFLSDWLARYAIKTGTIFGLLIWVHLIIISIFSFFVPKFNSLYIYIFTFLFFLVSPYKLRMK